MIALQKIRLHDTELHYTAQGSGEPLIFIHGAAGSAVHGEALMLQLEHRYKVHLYSQRFHLPNDPAAPGEYGVDQHAKDLIELIDVLRLDKVTAVAHSYGCQVLLKAAVHSPDKFKRLVLAEASLPFLLTHQSVYADIRETREKAFAQINESMRSGYPAEAVQLLMDYAIGGKGFKVLPEDIQKDMIANAGAFHRMLNSKPSAGNDFIKELRNDELPVDMFVGEHCIRMYRASAMEMQAMHEHVRVHEVKGVAHDLIYNASREIAELI